MLADLTPEQLDRYVEEVELPRRSTRWPAEAGRRIFRYGGVIGSEIEHHQRLGRAMLRARQHIIETEQGNRAVADGRIILADCLEAAKGRFVRTWHAPEGGLWGTLVYANTLLERGRLLLPVAVGVACCEALHDSGLEEARIRWINDVLCGARKVAGFLVETFTSPLGREEFFLIGFGVNVNNRLFPKELQETATSMSELLGRPVDLHRFACCFFAKLRFNLGLLHLQEAHDLLGSSGERDDAPPVIRRWRELSDSLGRVVEYGFDVMEDPQYRARAVAIENDGGLHLRLEDGTSIIEHSGEIRYVEKQA